MIANERTENVVASLFDYISDNYSETALELQGSNVIDTTAITEWVWFGITGIGPRQFIRHATTTEHGDLASFLVTAEINVKPTTSTIRTFAIADVVRNLLRRPSISVLDYVGGGLGVVGKLLGQGVLSEVKLPIENDLQKHVLTFRMQYLETYTA